MAGQIDQAFVNQFRSNVFHLSQQKGSRLRGGVRTEIQNGQRMFFERLGQDVAIRKTSRHMDTPQIDSDHSRRANTLDDYIWADLIDEEDQIRLLIDPESGYAQASMWAMGRAMDDEIIAAMRGNAYSGQGGTTAVPLPDAQKVLAQSSAAIGTPTDLNVDTLRAVKKVFDINDVDESIERYIAVSASQLANLLSQTQVTSADYNSVKALVSGQIDTFMGFKFIRTQRLPQLDCGYNNSTGAIVTAGGNATASNARRCLAWAKTGVVLGIGKDVEVKIDPRPDKNYATQVFARMSVGATRLEEAQVVEVVCVES